MARIISNTLKADDGRRYNFTGPHHHDPNLDTLRGEIRLDALVEVSNARYDQIHGPARRLVLVDGEWRREAETGPTEGGGRVAPTWRERRKKSMERRRGPIPKRKAK